MLTVTTSLTIPGGALWLRARVARPGTCPNGAASQIAFAGRSLATRRER